jgi:hypothetical protein
MKIRTGFVSNSSSSSFCIYGTYIEDDEQFDKLFGYKSKDDDDDSDDRWTFAENLLGDFVMHGPCDAWDGWYIGDDVTNCEDNQTMGEFKQSVIDKLNKISKKPFKKESFMFHEETYYS